MRERDALDRVHAEIETALSNLRAAKAVVLEARSAVEATERSHRSQPARFKAGTGLGIEVLEAQNAQAQARRALVQVILQYDAAQIELAASLGDLTSEVAGPPGRP